MDAVEVLTQAFAPMDQVEGDELAPLLARQLQDPGFAAEWVLLHLRRAVGYDGEGEYPTVTILPDGSCL